MQFFEKLELNINISLNGNTKNYIIIFILLNYS